VGSSPTDPTRSTLSVYPDSVVSARILFISPALPLPFGGADSRWQHVVLSQLPARGYDVTCLVLSGDHGSAVDEAKASAEAHGWRFVHVPVQVPNSMRRRIGTLRQPWSHVRFAPGVLPALAELEPERFDIVHVEHLFTTWLAPQLPRAVTYLHHLELVDWEGRTGLSPRERWTYLQMSRATRRLLQTTPRLIAATERVADDAVRLGARTRPPVAPVALDLSLYDELPFVTEPVVGVIGTMHWHPSLSAAQRVLERLWPRIRATVPDARLVVAGRGSQEFLGSYFPLEGATLLGEVAHPTDFFSRPSVLLYPPPRGSGVKIKVIEAMAYGLPVVSNREGLEAITCEDCVVRAETDDEIVNAVVALLRDAERRRAMRAGGRAFVEQQFAPGVAVDRLLTAYRTLGLAS
jgi:glycosyltransferase involved in cell wall biosynthesis